MNLNIICHGNKYIDLVANQQNENQNDKLENIVNTVANLMKQFVLTLKNSLLLGFRIAIKMEEVNLRKSRFSCSNTSLQTNPRRIDLRII